MDKIAHEVLAAAARWAKAFNRGDAQACAECYTSEAALRAVPLAELSGRKAIQAFWQGLIDQGFAEVRYLDPIVEPISENAAILSSPWAMNKARGHIHREEWRRGSDGVWRLADDHFEVLDQLDPAASADIVLVHGAWMGAWCWSATEALLEADGFRVRAIEFPAHGTRRAEAPPTDLSAYVETVIAELEACQNPAILIGHSFGGLTISQTAERAPEKIRGLVYLSAFLLPSGVSFFQASQGAEGSAVLDNLEFDPDRTQVVVANKVLHQAVGGDIPREAFDAARPLLVPEPCGPMNTPLSLSRERYGRVPRFYIETTEDRAIPLAAQRGMQSAMKLEEVFTIEASHLAMMSKPETLAKICAEIAGR